jgi:hypothetical protein
MGQTIGKIKVVVNNQSLGPINVKQSNQTQSKVQSISYGQPLEIGKALDLVHNPSANTGDAIVYNANTNTFEIQEVTAAAYVDYVFGGEF